MDEELKEGALAVYALEVDEVRTTPVDSPLPPASLARETSFLMSLVLRNLGNPQYRRLHDHEKGGRGNSYEH